MKRKIDEDQGTDDVNCAPWAAVMLGFILATGIAVLIGTVILDHQELAKMDTVLATTKVMVEDEHDYLFDTYKTCSGTFSLPADHGALSALQVKSRTIWIEEIKKRTLSCAHVYGDKSRGAYIDQDHGGTYSFNGGSYHIETDPGATVTLMGDLTPIVDVTGKHMLDTKKPHKAKHQ